MASPARFTVEYHLVALDEGAARSKARDICIEQTVEVPEQIVAGTWIEEQIVGRIEKLELKYVYPLASATARIIHRRTLHGFTRANHLAMGGEAKIVWYDRYHDDRITGMTEASPSCAAANARRDAAANVWRVMISYPEDAAGEELPQLMNVLFGLTCQHAEVQLVDFQPSPGMSAWLPGPRFGIEGLRRLCGVPAGPMLCTALKPMGRSVEELAAMAYSFAMGGIDIIKVSGAD